MTNIWVRGAEARDVPTIANWLIETPNNLLDKAVMFYPTTTTLVAYDAKKSLAVLPVQLVSMIESLGANPEATQFEVAKSLAELVKTAIFVSRTKGVKEIYVVIGDSATETFAERHGFERIIHPVFRLKLDTLENANNNQAS